MLLGVGFAGGLALMAGYFVWLTTFSPGGPFGFGFWNVWDKAEITLENRTGYPVRVYVEEELEALLAPHETDTIKDMRFLWWFDRPVEATANGRVIYTANLDYDDLKEMDFRIVIDDR